MAIEDLMRVVPPPEDPNHDERRLESTETRFGITFPTDYMDFVRTYGAGEFAGDTITSSWVLTPMDYAYVDEVDTQVGDWSDSQAAGEWEDIPFHVWPEENGLLPLAADNQASQLRWRIGKKAPWMINVWWSTHRGWEDVNLPLTTFLAKLFSRELTFPCWPEPFFTDNLSFSR